MAETPERVLTRHPDPAKQGVRIDRARYDNMRAALLRVIPAAEGVAYRELKTRVAPLLQPETFRGASVAWYVEVVKQDLLARALIERVPGRRPQHLRATGAPSRLPTASTPDHA